MIRRALPTLLRLAIVVLALAIGFWAGNRAYAKAHPDLPPGTDTAIFVPPTLPATCCVADVHDYAVPLAAPAPTASPAEKASRPVKATPAAGHTGDGSGRRTIRPHHQLTGVARWYGTGRSGFYAAAGCALRKAIGPDWRGRTVLVAYRRRAVEVRLNDSVGGCTRTLIDLSDEAFRALAPLSRGAIRVTVGH